MCIRDSAYAQLISRAAEQARAATSSPQAVVAVVARRPAKAACQLAERLAACGVQAIAQMCIRDRNGGIFEFEGIDVPAMFVIDDGRAALGIRCV